MENFTLDRSKTGLLVIDVQESLFPLVDHSCEVYKKICQVIKGFNILNIPMWVSEQYPEGLGPTLEGIQSILAENATYIGKTSFSCLKDEVFKQVILSSKVEYWVLIGIEAHVCILQTAKDILKTGQKVTVINDAISSRSIYDFSTAIAEMRDMGVRVTSAETVLFELLENSKAPEFKSISNLIKQAQAVCPCS